MKRLRQKGMTPVVMEVEENVFNRAWAYTWWIGVLTCVRRNVRLLKVLAIVFGLFPVTALKAQTQVKPGEKVTKVGETLQMQCGDFKVLLTCRHSDEIATRQRKYPRLCNDNTLAFIGKNGSCKVFETHAKGSDRDKTPIEAECEQYLPINRYQVRVLLHDTAASNVVRLADDAEPIKVADRLRYRVDYNASKTTGSIAIVEVSSWR